MAALTKKNTELEAKLSGLKEQEEAVKEKVLAKMKEAADVAKAKEAEAANAKAEVEKALKAQSKAEEMFLDSEATVDSQAEEIVQKEEEIETLKRSNYNLKVDLSGMELMILLAPERQENIDADALWDRMWAHIELKRGSIDQALDAVVEKYHSQAP